MCGRTHFVGFTCAQLAFLALTQPSAVAADGGSGGGLAGLLAAAAATRGGGGFGGSSIASQLSSDPLRPLALMPDLQVTPGDAQLHSRLVKGIGLRLVSQAAR
jgi:hypothetical protein